MTYTYTSANKRATMVEGIGTTTYSYDNAGRLTSVQNPYSETTTWTYNDANQMTRQTVASGVYTDYSYDSRGRQTGVTHKKSDDTTISAESYAFADNGNMTSKTVDSATTSYTYDDIDQLTGESRTGYACTYTYDANGNRLTKVLNNVTESYTYDDADKMLTAGSKTYTYDAAGRTTGVTVGNNTTTLAYDYEGRITQITYPNNSTNTFTYNGLDTRVGKVDSAGTKTFKRDGAGVTDNVLSDGFSTFTPGISSRTSGATSFLLGDFLKSFTRETDSNQATTATKQYDAFGALVASTGTSNSPFGFAGGFGYQEDGDSGLKLLGHRYYDASTGRFFTRDPAKDGRNWYAYCANNPATLLDPNGNIVLPGIDVDLLKEGFKIDPSHKYGTRWIDDDNNIGFDFHPAQECMKGWRGKDHYHPLEPSPRGWKTGKVHISPGEEYEPPLPVEPVEAEAIEGAQVVEVAAESSVESSAFAVVCLVGLCVLCCL
jgi:RHS repeat-associated protein